MSEVNVVSSPVIRLRERMARAHDAAMIFLRSRKIAYGLVFGMGDGNKQVPLSAKQFVLDDLKKFCRANRSTFHSDQRMSDILIGRREVYLRIVQHLNMEPEQLYAIANALPIQTTMTATGEDDAN